MALEPTLGEKPPSLGSRVGSKTYGMETLNLLLKVRRLIEWCHHGPSGAYVSNVKIEKTEPTGEFWGFTVKR